MCGKSAIWVGVPLMWMLPLYLHVNQKSDYDDMIYMMHIFRPWQKHLYSFKKDQHKTVGEERLTRYILSEGVEPCTTNHGKPNTMSLCFSMKRLVTKKSLVRISHSHDLLNPNPTNNTNSLS